MTTTQTTEAAAPLAVPYITLRWTAGMCRCHGLRWGYADMRPTWLGGAAGAHKCPLWHVERELSAVTR